MTEQKSTPEGLKPCRVPWCPATEPYLEETKDHFMFFCQGCGSRTHRHTTLEGALGEWNLPDKVTDRAAAPETAARLEKLEAALELADACIVAERKRVWSTVDSVANGDFEKAFIVALSQSQVPEQVKVYNQDKRARAALLQHLKENP